MAETQPGGRYKVGGQYVNAEGKPVQQEADSSDSGELDSALFTPAALKKAEESGLTATDFTRRRKSASEGTKFSVEDVERVAASKGEADVGEA